MSPGLLAWIKDCYINDDSRGSDHLPLVLELLSQIDTPAGPKLLRDEINGGRKAAERAPSPPPFAAKNWDQFRRRNITQFFTPAPIKKRVDIDLSLDTDDEGGP